MKYEHVENDSLRSLLVSGFNDESEVFQALNYTKSCLSEDMRNEDLPHSVLEERKLAFYNAVRAYFLGDSPKCVECLRQFWG